MLSTNSTQKTMNDIKIHAGLVRDDTNPAKMMAHRDACGTRPRHQSGQYDGASRRMQDSSKTPIQPKWETWVFPSKRHHYEGILLQLTARTSRDVRSISIVARRVASPHLAVGSRSGLKGQGQNCMIANKLDISTILIYHSKKGYIDLQIEYYDFYYDLYIHYKK